MSKRLDHWTDEDFKQLRLAFEAEYGPSIGQGRHRAVYRLDDEWVLKIPTQQSGIYASCHETEFEGGDQYAKAHLHEELTQRFGIPILQMEFVTHRGWSPVSDWTWCIDGGQVGFTKDGRLVAYDWEHF